MCIFQILVLAVLATLITAPAGAFGISLSGPKLLEQATEIESPEEACDRNDSNAITKMTQKDFDKRRTSALEIISKNTAYSEDDELENSESMRDTNV